MVGLVMADCTGSAGEKTASEETSPADQSTIATIDADGVALVAIQGLNRMVQEKEARIVAIEENLASQQRETEAMRRDNAAMLERLAALEGLVRDLPGR